MPADEIPRFEAMTTGGLLDRAFRLYAANFPLMIGITAAANVPLYAVQLALQAGVGAETSAAQVNVPALLVQWFVVLLWAAVALPLATGAATYAISERYLGNSITVGPALRRAVKRLWTLSMAQLSVGLRVFLGLLLLIVPGVLWSLSYALVVPIILIEGLKANPSLGRSWQLVKGCRGKVFLVLFTLYLLQWLLAFGAGSLSAVVLDPESTAGGMTAMVVSDATYIFSSPLIIIAAILLYYDFRIRKEGFDLEMLSRALAAAPEQAGASALAPGR